LVPGVIIFMVVLGFNLLGDGLRDVLDPRLQRLIALPSTAEKQEIEKPAIVVTEVHEESEIVADRGS